MVEILNVSNLSTAFQSDYGSKQALKNISFMINEGEVLALVGESGSGKTVTSLSIWAFYLTMPIFKKVI